MPDVVRTVGRYGIVSELGRGGMAVVYLAQQVDLDRLVALKELAAFHAADPSFAQRFVRESRLAGSLVHPNVITVFDYFEHAGTPYIAMEYVERGSLRPYVGRMSLAQIGGVLEGLLAGLAEAEQHQIVHRDLKPENLMVTAAGSVKIADFGIAKATQAADTGAFVTATGTTVGTPPYMAPEQAMGKGKEIGPWTDLYSVGCMAYELFTGKPPFYDAEEPLAILLRHITEPLPPASEVAGVDADISAWIERLTAKERARPPRVGDRRLGGARGDPHHQAGPALAAGRAAARAAAADPGPGDPAAVGADGHAGRDRPRDDRPGHAGTARRAHRLRDLPAAADRAADAGRGRRGAARRRDTAPGTGTEQSRPPRRRLRRRLPRSRKTRTCRRPSCRRRRLRRRWRRNRAAGAAEPAPRGAEVAPHARGGDRAAGGAGDR